MRKKNRKIIMRIDTLNWIVCRWRHFKSKNTSSAMYLNFLYVKLRVEKSNFYATENI